MNHAGRDRMGRTRLKTARSAVRSVSASTSAQLSARAAEPSAVRVARVPGAPPAGSWPAKGKPGRGTWLTPGRASDLARINGFSEACPALACSSSLRTVRRAATSLNQQLESLCPSSPRFERTVVLEPHQLTPPERRVWDAIATGEVVSLVSGDSEHDSAGGATWGPDRS